MSEAYLLFDQARRHLAAGWHAQASVALEKAKRLEPAKASIREALGIAYLRTSRFHEAEVEFRALLDLAPTNDYAHFALGRCLERQGSNLEARGHYRLATALRPGNADYRRALAWCEARHRRAARTVAVEDGATDDLGGTE